MPQGDDDFSAMLKRVRAASGTDAAAPDERRERPSKEPKPKPRRSRIVSAIWWSAVLGFVLLVFSGFASMGTWTISRFVSQGAASTGSDYLRRRLGKLRRLERYRLPVDTTITPLEAGKTVHAISRAGFDGELYRWERPVETRLGRGACCTQFDGPPSRRFDPKATWEVGAFRLARKGFNSDQRAFLNAQVNNPALGPFRRVARARTADFGGAFWDVPPDSAIGWPELPVMRFGGTRGAYSANIAAAALDLEAGRVALAEQRIREVISFGFLMLSGARSMFEEGFASALIGNGRYALEAFFRAVGRSHEADQVSADSDPAIPIAPSDTNRVPMAEVGAMLRRRILDTAELTSVRWQLALGPFAYLPCTTQRQMFFGPTAEHRAALKEFHDALVRYPSDERRFDMVVRNVMQLIDPASHSSGSAPRQTDWVRTISKLTRSDQFSRCAAMLSWQR